MKKDCADRSEIACFPIKTLFFKVTKQRRFQGTCVHTCVLVSGTYPEPVTGSAEPTYFCGSLKRNARFWLPPCLLLKFYY